MEADLLQFPGGAQSHSLKSGFSSFIFPNEIWCLWWNPADVGWKSKPLEELSMSDQTGILTEVYLLSASSVGYCGYLPCDSPIHVIPINALSPPTSKVAFQSQTLTSAYCSLCAQ